MSVEVTYQGVIPPNRFEKAALNLEIQGEQQESTNFFWRKYLELVFCREEGDEPRLHT